MQRMTNILASTSEAIIRTIIACGPSTSRQIEAFTGISGKSLGGHLAGEIRAGRLQSYKVPGHRTRYWLGANSLPAIGGLYVPGYGDIDFTGMPPEWFKMTISSPRSLPHLDGCAELGIVLARAGEGVVISERMRDLLEKITGKPLGLSVTGHKPDTLLFRKGRKPRGFEYERTDKSTEEGDEILLGWAETEDVEVFYVTPRKKVRQVVTRRVSALADGLSLVTKGEPNTKVMKAITIISAEESFPSAATLMGRALGCEGQMARPHNQGGRPRAKARRNPTKTGSRS